MTMSDESLREFTYICPGGHPAAAEVHIDNRFTVPVTTPYKRSDEIVVRLEVPLPAAGDNRHAIEIIGHTGAVFAQLYCADHRCLAPFSSSLPNYK